MTNQQKYMGKLEGKIALASLRKSSGKSAGSILCSSMLVLRSIALCRFRHERAHGGTSQSKSPDEGPRANDSLRAS